jgi:hypothetical protein
MNSTDPNRQRKGRTQLLLVLGVFLVPVLVAFALNTTGWMPGGRKNYGELVSPPATIDEAGLMDANDATPLQWANSGGQFRLVVRLWKACDAACIERIDHLNGLWRGLGTDAPRLEVWFTGWLNGPAEDAIKRFDAARGIVTTSAHFNDERFDAWLVDPNGFVVLRYPRDFELAGLRRDITKIIR